MTLVKRWAKPLPEKFGKKPAEIERYLKHINEAHLPPPRGPPQYCRNSLEFSEDHIDEECPVIQYLLEALLSNSDRYEVVAALNFLKHQHYDQLKAVCPFLTPDNEPGSFYIRVK